MSAEEVLDKIEMTEEKARNIVSHIVSQRIRWQQQYDGGEFTLGTLMDALVILAYSENEEAAELRKSLATANRQVGAANARETKRAKQIEELKGEGVLREQLIFTLTEEMESLKERLEQTRATIEQMHEDKMELQDELRIAHERFDLDEGD